jgi:hypothetical protein
MVGGSPDLRAAYSGKLQLGQAFGSGRPVIFPISTVKGPDAEILSSQRSDPPGRQMFQWNRVSSHVIDEGMTPSVQRARCFFHDGCQAVDACR